MIKNEKTLRHIISLDPAIGARPLVGCVYPMPAHGEEVTVVRLVDRKEFIGKVIAEFPGDARYQVEITGEVVNEN
jgi:hypothetical protein